MFNIINFLAITSEGHEPWISPDEAELLEQQAQDKSIWIVILILLLVMEIFFALFYPKLKAKRKLKQEEKNRRKATHREKR